jgi:hypothetical protein
MVDWDEFYDSYLSFCRFFWIELVAPESKRGFEIAGFGNVKRSELIEKWITLGREEGLQENEHYLHLDSLVSHIDAFVRKNVVPARPVYLLTILQSIDAANPQRLEFNAIKLALTHWFCFKIAAIEPSQPEPTVMVLKPRSMQPSVSEAQLISQIWKYLYSAKGVFKCRWVRGVCP